jgi:hypothetical protein
MSKSSECLFVADYRNLILVEKPAEEVTIEDQERTQEQIYAIKREFNDYMNVTRLTASTDTSATHQAIESAMGGQPARSIVMPFLGDGRFSTVIPAVLGNGAVVAKPQAGFADNVARSSHPLRYRSDPVAILKNANITRARVISATVTDKDGNVKDETLALDVFGVGLSGHWNAANNEPEHREARNALPSKNKRLRYDVTTIFPKVIETDPFRIVRLSEENGEEIRADEESYRELMLANLSHIAMGRIRRSHMSDPKLVEIGKTYGKSRLVKRASLLFLGAQLLSAGIGGNDLPDGEELRFEVLDHTKYEVSGEAKDVEPGDRFHIRRTAGEILVATTRRQA